jgi:tRNA (guanine10-N2)-dimethyltransferase
MGDFNAKSICILGRQPKLGLAELESLYGAGHIRALSEAAVLDIPAEQRKFQYLGGTIKTARILSQLPYSNWHKLAKYLQTQIPSYVKHLPAPKFTLGLSVYGLNIGPAEINRTILELKKLIKKGGRSVRVVPNKNSALSSAQVLHNKLTHKGAWELVLVANGQQTILAQTLFVQDIDAYAARDQARPARDARVGMLPPKLAQIIINLALGKKNEAHKRIRVLDPFCGTGVILQEAMLMGCDVAGTDIDERMVKYAKTNISWLVNKYPEISSHASAEVGDATNYIWPRFTTIASEVYLGRPLARLPGENELEEIIHDTNSVIEKFLKNLSHQLKRHQRICLALPAWRMPNRQLVHLPAIAKLTDMGYNTVKFKHTRHDDLVYFREDQIVARQLVVMERR